MGQRLDDKRIMDQRFQGVQRYRCKECGKNFSETTGTLLVWLRKKEKWTIYLRCMLSGYSLRRCAANVNEVLGEKVSEHTILWSDSHRSFIAFIRAMVGSIQRCFHEIYTKLLQLVYGIRETKTQHQKSFTVYVDGFELQSGLV